MMNPMELGTKHPIRKTKAQKEAFRADIRLFARENGYPYREEACPLGRNLILGDPEKAEYLITAHYDTPARMLFPNLITPCSALGFYGYRIAQVGLLVAAGIAVGLACSFLLGNVDLGSAIGGAAYVALLMLTRYGPANPHNRNDNTSGVVTVLEIARTLPALHRDKAAFILFDREEQGLIGSASYRKAHRAETDNQPVLNLDCVGDGDTLMMFPSKKLKKDADRMAALRPLCGKIGYKVLLLRERGFAAYPSDQKNFPLGLGIAAFRRGKFGPFASRIHTPRDTILEEANVNLLRSALTTYVTCGAVNKKG